MGKSVIFIGKTTLSLEKLRVMTFEEAVEKIDFGEKQFDILFKENYGAYVSFQFDYNGAIANDYSPEELKNLPYKYPQFVLVRYSNIRLLERIVSADDFPKDILIDCDGVNMGLEKFIKRSRLLNTDA